MKTKKQLILPIIIVFVMTIIDQITKQLAQLKLAGGTDFIIIPKVFRLQYLENQSAAFSMDPITLLDKIFHFKAFANDPALFLKAKMWFFVLLTAIVLVLVAFLYYKIPQNKRFMPLNIVIILLFAGAIGNCIDRVWHNYVIDFFYFELINFPVFNVADIYVTFAAIGLIILLLFYYKEDDFKVIFPSKREKK